jgi:branched-chain amino acid transport system substrate-binding protein
MTQHGTARRPDHRPARRPGPGLARRPDRRPDRPAGWALVALAAVTLLAAAGCSGGGSAGATASAAPVDTGLLGTPKAASGTPVLFGVLNLESGPVTFPEVVQAEQAAVRYVNAYRGGLGGHPIKLVSCATDGQPATSQRCANQLADQKPVAVLGGADTGAPGAFPVWQREHLAYLGGVPFTPAEQNSPLSVIFSSVSTGDNAAATVYAAKTLKAKKAAIIYTSDTEGTSVTNNVLAPVMKNVGISSVTKVAIPPTSSDVASAVATAVGAHPDIIYVNAPAACPNILSSLRQLGNTAKILGVDPCTSPKAIAGANGGADGLYFAGPTYDANADNADAKLYRAALAKYAPSSISLDSLAAIGFQTVLDVQAALANSTGADLTTDRILAAFKTGREATNFMGHPYLCDGRQLAGASSVCNAYEQIRQIRGGRIVVASPDFVTAGSYYRG